MALIIEKMDGCTKLLCIYATFIFVSTYHPKVDLRTLRSYAYRAVLVLPLDVTIPRDSNFGNCKELATPLTVGGSSVMSGTPAPNPWT